MRWMMGLFRRGRTTGDAERAIAVIRGIKILTPGEDTPTRQRLRIEVDGPMPSVDGVELTGAPRWIRFGQSLPVVRCGKGWEVDWDEVTEQGALPTSVARVKPPDAGIDDKTSKAARAQRKGAPCMVEIREVTGTTLLGMSTDRYDLVTTITADGMEAYSLDLRRQEVPFYAAHLLHPTTTVPGWVREGRPDKVVIDWPQAALAEHGIGVRAFEADEAQQSDLAAPAVNTAMAFVSRFVPEGAPATADGDPSEEAGADDIDFDTWVAVEAGLVRDRVAPADHAAYAEEHGVASGRWAEVSATWHGRVRADWELGARFGAAYAEALKRR
ncbi:hypothetical protein [Actinospongicola halichondriae]|uniref:hypothetical protein n=1 Tax=Actinospongicola halichondriae TaxID=3236844 RepID=UPI003D50F934